MPGSDRFDQCPFCNEPWGECSHVRLLAKWEEEALIRQAERELGDDNLDVCEEQAEKSGRSDSKPMTGRSGG